MKKIIRLNEKDLKKLIKRLIKEDEGDGQQDDWSEFEGRPDIYVDSTIENPNEDDLGQDITEDWD